MARGPDRIPAIAHGTAVERYRSMDGEAYPEGCGIPVRRSSAGFTDGGAMFCGRWNIV